MTRINVGIPPKDLCRQHLLAEARESKRVPNVIRSGRFNMNGQPSQFTLGSGHVKFFYDKLLYLKNRYEELYNECLNRGYNVTYFGSAWNDIPSKYMNDYIPKPRDIEIIKERIAEKLKTMNL